MSGHRLEPGAVIDGFRLEERLHRGGMADIWRVAHPDIPEPIVMKAPRIAYGEAPEAMVGFETEQMILPRLSGRHVPRTFAVGDFSRQPYIVMERIAGRSLLKRLDGLPLPVDEVAAIGVKVATALHDVHRQHVIHLDVKPSNVMVRGSGEAVLIDFGLAHSDELPDLFLEESPVPVGTGPYIAPEQLLGVRDDLRSDIFALGVMLYFFATGVRPFGEPETEPGLRVRLWRDPAPLRALRPDCPLWLQEVVLRAIEVDPDARTATAAQLAFDLAHPEQVPLTARAERLTRDGLFTTARRWLKSREARPRRHASVSSRLAAAPILLAAIDLAEGMAPLAEALRTTVRRILTIEPGARLACVNVIRISRVAMDVLQDEQGRMLHVQRLIELKHWARPLALPEDRISFHVLEAVDPADALIGYAERNHVDHIVIGARASSAFRRYLGSVSSHVVAEAPCSVTVVRLPRSGDHGGTTAGAEDAGATASVTPVPESPLSDAL